jgi:hypothetical protein
MEIAFDVDVEEAMDAQGGFSGRIRHNQVHLSEDYCEWVWATEEQVRNERIRDFDLPVLEKQVVLDGFALRKAEKMKPEVEDLAEAMEDVVMHDGWQMNLVMR